MASSSLILESGDGTSNLSRTAAKIDTKPHNVVDFDTFINNLFLYIDFSLGLKDDDIATNYLMSNQHRQNNEEVKILLFAIANLAQSWTDPSRLPARSFNRHGSIANSSDAAFCPFSSRVHSIVTVIAKKIDAKISSEPKVLTQEEKDSIASVFCSTMAESRRGTVRLASQQISPVSSQQHVVEKKTSCSHVIKKLDSNPLNKNKTNAPKNLIIEKIFHPLNELLKNTINITEQLASDTIIHKIVANIRELRKQLEQELVAELGKGTSVADLKNSKQAQCVNDTVTVLCNVFTDNTKTIEKKNKSISEYHNKYKTQTSCTAKFAKVALCLAAGLAGLLAGVLLCAIAGFGTGLVTGGIGAAPGCAWGLVTGFTYTYYAVTVSAAHLTAAAICGAACAGGAAYRLFRENNNVSKKVAELAGNLNKAEKTKTLAYRLSLD